MFSEWSYCLESSESPKGINSLHSFFSSYKTWKPNLQNRHYPTREVQPSVDTAKHPFHTQNYTDSIHTRHSHTVKLRRPPAAVWKPPRSCYKCKSCERHWKFFCFNATFLSRASQIHFPSYGIFGKDSSMYNTPLRSEMQ